MEGLKEIKVIKSVADGEVLCDGCETPIHDDPLLIWRYREACWAPEEVWENAPCKELRSHDTDHCIGMVMRRIFQ